MVYSFENHFCNWCVLIGPTKQQSGDPENYVKFEVPLCLWEISLHNYGCHYRPSIMMTSRLHAINLCCIVVGLSFTMSAQHNSNIGSASFICVIVDFFCVIQKMPVGMFTVTVSTTLCLMLELCSLGQHDTLTKYWSNHRPITIIWFNVVPSVATQAQHWENIWSV